jgi:hypothetical protein
MPATHDVVQVKGLKEFRNALKALDDKSLENDLKRANQRVGRLVVDKAQGNASTRLEQRSAATLKASLSGFRAQVNLGGASFPAALGAEFGAQQNVLRDTRRGQVLGWNQFKEWRGSGENAGYFLYPAIRESEDEIIELYGDEIEALAAKAFPD